MTTLAADARRPMDIGERNEFPVIAADIIYEGAAVGLVDATGHAQPLAAANRFGGFAEQRADNSAGAAAAINVRVIEKGKVQLSVSGAVITDVGQPVYATDDDTFVFSPVSAAFIGFVKRFVSAGVVIVAFDALSFRDPYQEYAVRETLAAGTLTLDAEDTGKLIWCTVDTVITLPSIADGLDAVKIVNGGVFGDVEIGISPAAADKLHGPNVTAADDKDYTNTAATARRGDFVVLGLGDADGYFIQQQRGTWARQA